MALIRALARPMLASIFVIGGYDVFKNPASRAPLAHKVVGPATEQLPVNTEQVVKADAAVKIAAGSLLAIGKLRRLSAVALAASLVPTTLAGHPYWEETDPAKRAQQRTQFLKNLSMLGGLLYAATER